MVYQSLAGFLLYGDCIFLSIMMVTDINNMGDKKVRKKFSLLLIVVLGFIIVSCSTFLQRKNMKILKNI